MNYENYLLTLDKIIPLYYEDVQFWVNDPSNEAASNSNQLEQELNNKRDGFNDLERRKNDLCSLANGCCDKFCDDNLLMDALKEATFIPLPTHGH